MICSQIFFNILGVLILLKKNNMNHAPFGITRITINPIKKYYLKNIPYINCLDCILDTMNIMMYFITTYAFSEASSKLFHF